MEAALVTALCELFAKTKQPTQEDKEGAAQTISSLIEQAKALGHAHASDELERSQHAWGGNFAQSLGSAWAIVNTFVQRIADWMSGQPDASEEDVLSEVDALANKVGGYEVASAIEQEVLDSLTAQGETMARSIPQAGACQRCLAIASAGPVPISQFIPPPYHGFCRCQTGRRSEVL